MLAPTPQCHNGIALTQATPKAWKIAAGSGCEDVWPLPEDYDPDFKDLATAAVSAWERYPLTSAHELATKPKPVRWLVGGVWVQRSAGVLAGKKKAFKTWSLHSLSLAVATHLNYLDEFPVFSPGPVLYLTGEGGQDEFKSRHHALAKRYGIGRDELNDCRFQAMFDVAALDDVEYLDALRHHLDMVQPVLVCIDPLYAYHPKDVDVSNVYSRGQMLAKIRSEIEPYAALIVGDHINKSADDSRLDLDDIGFSGVSQWADSWSLQRHRAPFQTVGPNSYAKLEVEFGSRRTGSMRYEIDWTLVRDISDPHVIQWESCDWAVIKTNVSTALRVITSDDEAIRALQNHVEATPTVNKTGAVIAMLDTFKGRSRDEWRALWDRAIKQGYIVAYAETEEQPYRNSTRTVDVTRFKRGCDVGQAVQR